MFNHPTPVTNIPELTVSELSGAIKRTIEDAFGYVRVRGELSRVTLAKSGHLYTNLKDDAAVLDAVCWKGTLLKLGIKPEEGMEVVCTGRLTTYPGRSNYQLVIEGMELAGIGAILKMLEARKAKMAAEGWFDAANKQPLPFLPTTIGVITSPTGAVIRDIIHRIADRFPLHVLVWPVVVQGANAAAEIVNGIEGFNNLPEDGAIPRPDLIIVARGGGSFEDLMPFNEESVVRAAATSDIPLISAVGHETDVTLIDFAADVRAPTPTAAAEISVPVRANLIAQILEDEQRLLQALFSKLDHARLRLEAYARTFNQPQRVLEAPVQRLDRAALQMEHTGQRRLMAADQALNRIAARLRTPSDIVNAAGLRTTHAADRLKSLPPRFIDPAARQVESLARMLESLSFKRVQERGYAVVKDAEGKLVSRAAALKAGQDVTLSLYDGERTAEIKN